MNSDTPDLTITEAIELFIHWKRPDRKGKIERSYRKNLGDFVDHADELGIETLDDPTRRNVGAFSDFLLEKDLAPTTIASQQAILTSNGISVLKISTRG